MDTELLRVVIIATGLLVIVAMLTWHFIKNRKLTDSENLFGNLPLEDVISDSLVIHNEQDDFEITPKTSKRYAGFVEQPPDDFGEFSDIFVEEDEAEQEQPPSQRFSVPEIIQFSLITKNEQGFNGLDLLNAFLIAHLEYGNLKIFERLDANRLVDFGVACMVDAGTFPETGMENFYCPGLVFFMQPSMVDDPASVFDDFVDTIKLLAIELDGEALDHQRQPLTEETIQLFRQSL